MAAIESIINRHQDEIKQLAQEKDLSRTTRRLMDISQDFNLPQSVQQKVVALRVAYNDTDNADQLSELQNESLALLAEVESLLSRRATAGLNLPELTPWTPQKNQDNTATIASSDSSQSLSENWLDNNSIAFGARGLTKSYRPGKFKFQLKPLALNLILGQITGVVGENGNGKTTLLRLIAGDLAHSGGIIAYPALEGGKILDWYTIKQQIAYIPQQIRPWTGKLKTNLQFTAALNGLLGVENIAQVDFLIHRLGLTKYADSYWDEISTGYRLRFELARALVKRPHLLVLDEPLANLDINTRALFLQDLRYLATSIRYPMAVILSSQQLQEVEAVSDNIIFLRAGEAIYNGPVKGLGADRSENVFELAITANRVALYQAFADLPNVRIEDQGLSLFIYTPVEITSQLLMQRLIAHQIQVEYFREISQSTRRLFLEN
jgi:ABC-2 type transport system ATP-binding protein